MCKHMREGTTITNVRRTSPPAIPISLVADDQCRRRSGTHPIWPLHIRVGGPLQPNDQLWCDQPHRPRPVPAGHVTSPHTLATTCQGPAKLVASHSTLPQRRRQPQPGGPDAVIDNTSFTTASFSVGGKGGGKGVGLGFVRLLPRRQRRRRATEPIHSSGCIYDLFGDGYLTCARIPALSSSDIMSHLFNTGLTTCLRHLSTPPCPSRLLHWSVVTPRSSLCRQRSGVCTGTREVAESNLPLTPAPAPIVKPTATRTHAAARQYLS